MLLPSLLSQPSLSAGRYLLKINQPAVVRDAPAQREQITHVIGELEYLVDNVAAEEANSQFARIGLISSAIGTSEDGTGRISVHTGRDTGSRLVHNGSHWQLTLTLDAAMLYEAVQRAQPRENEGQRDYFDTPSEGVRAILDGVITPVETPIVETEIGRFSGKLIIGYLEGGLHRIDEIRLLLEQVSIFYLGAPSGDVRLAAQPAEQGAPVALAAAEAVAIEHKMIRIQPIIFADSLADPLPTGRTLVAQFDEANRLWNQGCIHFVLAGAPHLIVDPALKMSNNYSALERSFVVMDDQGQALNVIEVYFVDNELTTDGGGYTRDGRSGLAKVFISDRNALPPFINPRLLAHELGHVLSLAHPDEASIGYTLASAGSLMEADIPNPDFNTLHNCRTGNNPAQATSPVIDCLPMIV